MNWVIVLVFFYQNCRVFIEKSKAIVFCFVLFSTRFIWYSWLLFEKEGWFHNTRFPVLLFLLLLSRQWQLHLSLDKCLQKIWRKKNNSTTKISNHCMYHAVHYNLTCVNRTYLENENKNVSCYKYIKLISRVTFISKCYLKLTFCVISFIIWQTNARNPARNTPIWLLKDPLPKFHDENNLISKFLSWAMEIFKKFHVHVFLAGFS